MQSIRDAFFPIRDAFFPIRDAFLPIQWPNQDMCILLMFSSDPVSEDADSQRPEQTTTVPLRLPQLKEPTSKTLSVPSSPQLSSPSQPLLQTPQRHVFTPRLTSPSPTCTRAVTPKPPKTVTTGYTRSISPTPPGPPELPDTEKGIRSVSSASSTRKGGGLFGKFKRKKALSSKKP